MKGDIPVFKKCCFCLPLRRGLLAWGYFKVTADAFLLPLMTYIFTDTLMMMSLYARKDFISWIYIDLTILMIGIVVLFADFIGTIIFIVGGHKKNLRLIRIFYYLSMGMWVITSLLLLLTVVRSIHRLITYNVYSWGLGNVLASLCSYFVILAVQTYFLLLLRSEIIKLRNPGEFRFVNNAAEAECTMKCEEIVVEAETVQQDV